MKVVEPVWWQSSFRVQNLQSLILPGQMSLTVGMNLHREDFTAILK